MSAPPGMAAARPSASRARVTIVVLTHDRPQELRRVLQHLGRLPEQAPVVVVDNASRPGVVPAVVAEFPGVTLLRCPLNRGAAGRNAGVEQVRTPYVAFCDDDTWWAPGALGRAEKLLDAHPELAALSARVLVGPAEREDPTCRVMAQSPIDAAGLPGPALVSFMAGACVMRSEAFRAVGGYEPRLFLGAEELLMGLDFGARGWRIVYTPEVVTHHHPSAVGRDPAGRRIAVARNRVWIACMRLPWRLAWQQSRAALREAHAQGVLRPSLLEALAGLPWALRRRRCVPAAVSEDVAAVAAQAAGAAPTGRPRARWRIAPDGARALADRPSGGSRRPDR